MGSTQYLARVSDEDVARMLWDAVGVEGDTLVGVDVDRSGDAVSATVRYETRLDGEDDDTLLSDYYELDDYDIDPYDWGGSTAGVCLAWRKAMLGRFGEGYALRYLVGMLEEAVEGE